MKTQPFLPTVPGRIFLAVLGINLALMGALALLGPGPWVTYALYTSPLLTGLALSTAMAFAFAEREDELPGVLVVVAPFAGGVGFIALSFVAGAGAAVGLILLAAGVAAGVQSLWGLVTTKHGGAPLSTPASQAR